MRETRTASHVLRDAALRLLVCTDFLRCGGYFACAETRSNISVPLLKRTFFVVETIVDPCAVLDFLESRESPSSPKTPLLFEDNRPEERVDALAVPFDPAETGLDVFIVAPETELPRAEVCVVPIAPPEAIALSMPAPDVDAAVGGAAMATMEA